MTTPCCPTSFHDAMKSPRLLYEAVTQFRGWQEQVDDAPLELRTCRICGSTLSDGTLRDDELVHVAPRAGVHA